MEFGSDNQAGTSQKILDVLASANTGFTHGYGDDQWCTQAEEALAAFFNHPLEAFFVATGTAANSLALAAVLSPWETVLCHVITSYSIHYTKLYDGQMAIRQSTIAMNVATNGAGINNSRDITMVNTLFAANNGENCEGSGEIVSLGGNLDDNNSCAMTTTDNDIFNIDPRIYPLENSYNFV